MALRMTETEYVTWCEAQAGNESVPRTEFVDGEVVFLPTSKPKDNHLALFIAALLQFVGDGYAYNEVVEMQLRAGLRRMPVVLYVSQENASRIQESNVLGPCDIAFEVVTRDSGKRDYQQKYREYEAYGVGEYWIIDPKKRKITQYRRQGERLVEVPAQDGLHQSAVVPKFYLREAWIVPGGLPPLKKAVSEMDV